MVPPARFERTAFPLGGGRSIQLSYEGNMMCFTKFRIVKIIIKCYDRIKHLVLALLMH